MRIPARFGGPPGTANGGVIAATLAIGQAAEVTIRRPVPVERDVVCTVWLEAGDATLTVDDEVLAEGRRLSTEEVEELRALAAHAPRVSFVAARAARQASPLAEHHPFPTCFGCGPDAVDGIHCLAGPVSDGVWAVEYVHATEDDPRFVWAALDCPSSAPILTPGGEVHVLGRIAGAILSPVAALEEHVVVAWRLGEEGRRKHSASVILGPDGEPRAVARATWVQLKA